MIDRSRRLFVLAVLLAAGDIACKSKPRAGESVASAAPTTSPSKLVDLSSSLEAIRTAFNAHKQEARFLTLLSPA